MNINLDIAEVQYTFNFSKQNPIATLLDLLTFVMKNWNQDT